MRAVNGHATKDLRPGLEKLVYADAALEAPETIRVESVAFEDNEPIPPLFTVDGERDLSAAALARRAGWSGGHSAACRKDPDSSTPTPLIHAAAVKEPGLDDDLIPRRLDRRERRH